MDAEKMNTHDLTDGCTCIACVQTRLIQAQQESIRKLTRQLREAQTESDNWRREYTLLKGEPWHV